MGTICILLGLIFLIGFSGAGFIAANAVKSMGAIFSIMGNSFGNESMLYGIIVGLFVVIGLLVCLNLVMHGLTYNKVSKLYAIQKKQVKK